MSIRVMHFGLGPIGCSIAKQIAGRPGFKSVGAIDVDPAKAGRDLGDVASLGYRVGLTVASDAAKALRAAKPDVVVHCTSSSLARVLPQLEMILKAKAAVVSTTEELAYPFQAHPREARRIDAWAKKARVAVAGTGVNPGFSMDALPIALCAACERVDRIVVKPCPGCANPSTALSAEDWIGPYESPVRSKSPRSERPSRGDGGVDCDDCGFAGVAPRSDHG